MLDLGKIDELRIERHNILVNLAEAFDNDAYVSEKQINRVYALDNEIAELWGVHSFTIGYDYCYGKGRLLG